MNSSVCVIYCRFTLLPMILDSFSYWIELNHIIFWCNLNSTINIFEKVFSYQQLFMQPAFLVSIFATKDDTDVQLTNSKDVKRSTSEASLGPHRTKISSLVEGLLQFVGRSEDLINRYVNLKLFWFLSFLYYTYAISDLPFLYVVTSV